MACKFCGKPWSVNGNFYFTTENEHICHDCFRKYKFKPCRLTKKIITVPGFKCNSSNNCEDCDYYYKNKASNYYQELKKSTVAKKSEESQTNFIKYFVIGWLILAVIAIGISSCEDNNEFEDVFRKDPNTWTEREKEHVNNFFDWLEEQN